MAVWTFSPTSRFSWDFPNAPSFREWSWSKGSLKRWPTTRCSIILHGEIFLVGIDQALFSLADRISGLK